MESENQNVKSKKTQISLSEVNYETTFGISQLQITNYGRSVV